MSDTPDGNPVFIIPFTQRPPVYREGGALTPALHNIANTVTGTSGHVVATHSATFDLFAFDQMYGSGYNGTTKGTLRDKARMGVIAGTVLDIQAQPVSRRVRVHDRTTGHIVRETWSDADGKYRFTDLDPRRAFYVMAFDHTLQQNAVVSDNVHSEVEDTP
ncbi:MULTISPECIES: carboxypeptidase-like regulatory domain-containing protein [Cobetia]|uniref:carboxypeptidase-like regulatory domain-containing protein n=1 Tax=Cobetia TaxID=204286 RepID=UPI000CDA14CC|nr:MULTISPECIES: carboxypeptidase-like regulatory domain-containing protein [Cobetia]POR07194.1 hypothetical protein BOH68_06240 [Cobetia sp. MM1IDA2H-1]